MARGGIKRWLLNKETAPQAKARQAIRRAEAAPSSALADAAIDEASAAAGGDVPVAGAVDLPAFSITKVLASVSTVVTVIATVVTGALDDKGFNLEPGHVIALALGLLAFLAIASSADVLARSIATNKQAAVDQAVREKVTELEAVAAALKAAADQVTQDAVDDAVEDALAERDAADSAAAAAKAAAAAAEQELRDTVNLIHFDKPFAATYSKDGLSTDITVLGASGGGRAHYVIMEAGKMRWMPVEDVTLGAVAPP